jgi:hypothetical protein
MKHFCKLCKKELKLVGVQNMRHAGFEYDLMHCDDKKCAEFEMTQTYNVRILNQELYDAYLTRNSKK